MAALAAQDQALQERWPLSRRTRFASRTTGDLEVFRQAFLVGQELLPTQITRVSLRFKKTPLLARQLLGVTPALRVLPTARSTVTERSRVARMVQGIQRHPTGQRRPTKLAPAGRTAIRELELLAPELLHRRARRTGALKGGKEHAQALLHLLVWIQNHPVLLIIDQPRRQQHPQLAPLRFAHDPANHACPDEVQLRFAHRPFEAQQQPVVIMARIVEPVLIED